MIDRLNTTISNRTNQSNQSNQSQLEFLRHHSGGSSTIVLHADGSFSQHTTITTTPAATAAAAGAAAATPTTAASRPAVGWSQIKRGRFVARHVNANVAAEATAFSSGGGGSSNSANSGGGDADLLELEFHASGVETRGSPAPNAEATQQLSQRWTARLEGALTRYVVLASPAFICHIGLVPALPISLARGALGAPCPRSYGSLRAPGPVAQCSPPGSGAGVDAGGGARAWALDCEGREYELADSQT